MNGKRVAFIGVMSALSAIMFMVESLFPPLFVPGAKLGLGNVFILLTLIYMGYGSALITLAVKCLVTAIFSGFSTLLYSLPSGLVSLTVSFILLNFSKHISIVAISATSAVVNNLIQNLIFALVTDTFDVLLYSPYLALLGVIAGVLTGLVTLLILRNLSSFVIKKFDLKQNLEEHSGTFKKKHV